MPAERWQNIFENVAVQAEEGCLKSVKLLADYYFFPPKIDPSGQIKLDFNVDIDLSKLNIDELRQLDAIQRKIGVGA